jgi:hypothetical protein
LFHPRPISFHRGTPWNIASAAATARHGGNSALHVNDLRPAFGRSGGLCCRLPAIRRAAQKIRRPRLQRDPARPTPRRAARQAERAGRHRRHRRHDGTTAASGIGSTPDAGGLDMDSSSSSRRKYNFRIYSQGPGVRLSSCCDNIATPGMSGPDLRGTHQTPWLLDAGGAGDRRRHREPSFRHPAGPGLR